MDSITNDSPGRYHITGTALDANGSPACALVLASGRCMFSCGPGSPRCEGGTAGLDFGRFELTDLPLEPNGTIILQTFIQGHVSGTSILNVSGTNFAQWGAVQGLCCNSGGTLTFTVKIDGDTRSSTTVGCGGTPSFQGYTSTSAGNNKQLEWEVEGACIQSTSGNGTVNFAANKCYLISSHLNAASQLEFPVTETNCGSPFSVGGQQLRLPLQAIDGLGL